MADGRRAEQGVLRLKHTMEAKLPLELARLRLERAELLM